MQIFLFKKIILHVLSSPEPKVHWWGYRIIRRPSYVVVRRPRSLNILSSEKNGPIKVKLHVELLWDGKTKHCSNGSRYMANIAAMLIYVKNLKHLLLWNQKADDLPSLFIWWPWIDLDLFYGKVKFGPWCFCMGKGKTMDFSETIVVNDIKIGRCS